MKEIQDNFDFRFIQAKFKGITPSTDKCVVTHVIFFFVATVPPLHVVRPPPFFEDPTILVPIICAVVVLVVIISVTAFVVVWKRRDPSGEAPSDICKSKVRFIPLYSENMIHKISIVLNFIIFLVQISGTRFGGEKRITTHL